MRILVTAASRHGATQEVADAIAERLRANGAEVVVAAPEDVENLDGFDAAVVGSAVYMRQWDQRALALLDRVGGQLKTMPVWGFSVGMAGVPKRAPQDPRRIGPNDTERLFQHHRAFAGRYDPTILPLRERTIARMAGAVEGDFRDWEAIAGWADTISADLSAANKQ